MKQQRRFSLHAQGWPLADAFLRFRDDVLPARAGMALSVLAGTNWPIGSPCTRRDGPDDAGRRYARDVFSLHAQGWPQSRGEKSHHEWFSLHAQGWPSERHWRKSHTLVLPARAGMAQTAVGHDGQDSGSPCTRRDGPPPAVPMATYRPFSLHAQGWPDFNPDLLTVIGVLPARAGMARFVLSGTPFLPGSPCTRRDGPQKIQPWLS